MITPTHHAKMEWARMAQAAYGQGQNDVGHRYSAYAALRHEQSIPDNYYDTLQRGYRLWLIENLFPEINTMPVVA